MHRITPVRYGRIQPCAAGDARPQSGPASLRWLIWRGARRSQVVWPSATPAELASLCTHDWRFAGQGVARDGWCSSPVRIVCRRCSTWFDRACGSARSARCGYCAAIKTGDVASIGRSGWSDRPTARAVWMTLTAPGVDVLPWDTSQCSHGPGVRCGGAIGCRVDANAAAVWHDGMASRWTHFVTELRRSLNPGLTGPPSSWPVRVEFFKTYEPQERNALHVHAMLRVDGPCTWRRFVAMASKARRLNGFGPQMDVRSVDISSAEQAAIRAGYCAKYTSKNADALPSCRRIDRATGEVRYGGLRSWSASRRWGLTMGAVQGRRRAYAADLARAAAHGSMPFEPPLAAALDSYCGIYADQQPGAPPSCSS